MKIVSNRKFKAFSCVSKLILIFFMLILFSNSIFAEDVEKEKTIPFLVKPDIYPVYSPEVYRGSLDRLQFDVDSKSINTVIDHIPVSKISTLTKDVIEAICVDEGISVKLNFEVDGKGNIYVFSGGAKAGIEVEVSCKKTKSGE